MPEQRVTIGAPLRPEEVSGRSFPPARRGLDGEAVRRFLEEVAGSLRELYQREEDLRRRLEDAEARAAAPVLDEATVTAAVGSETAKVLRAAHEAAREVVARAEEQAAGIMAAAGSLLEERRQEAESEAAGILERARSSAEELERATKEQCRSMVDEAREVRRRVLADLAERRRELHLQLERLRAGKDALAEVIVSTVRSVEEVRARLAMSEDEARAAAGTIEPVRDAPPAALGPEAAETTPDSGPTPASGPRPASGPATAAETSRASEPVLVPDLGEPAGAPDPAEPQEREPAPGAGQAPEPGQASAVDDIFARLRAATSGAEAQAAGGGDPEAAEGETLPAGSGRAARPARGTLEVPSGERQAHEEPLARGVAEGAFLRRDELLAPVVAELARVLKRELRFAQNELLDELRNRHGAAGATPEELVRAEEVAERLATVTWAPLLAAWRAGGSFACPPGHAVAEPGPVLGELGAALAEELVASLRTRLAGAEEGADPGELLGAAYRYLRGERVDEIAADHASAAFALGELGSLDGAGAVLWVAAEEGHCPDCDDNALAGPVPAGQAFPTGQSHPPVHPGCRCLLVPASA